jgi:tetratricopeptide (TPR) repeat protein
MTMPEPTATSPTDSAPSGPGDALLAEGRAHYAEGQYQEALSCLHLAYDARSSQADSDPATQSGIAEAANDIGVVYTVLKRWQDAEKWLGEAQQGFALSGDLDGEAQTLGNLGSMYRARRDFRQAAAYLQLSADRFHLAGDDERRAASLRALSVVRLLQLRPLRAVIAYREALACHPNPGLVVKLLQALFDLPFRLQQR